MYSVRDYGWMLDDEVRRNAYAEALCRAVRPGCVVADIGTGIGYFAMLACRLGARRVYAIEPDNAIDVARQLAAQHGCNSQIEFVQKLSTEVTLPERADVIISDLRGVLPLFEEHIPSIMDARVRLLKADGVLIAQRDRVWGALVESSTAYENHICPKQTVAPGFDMTLARRIASNNWRKVRLQAHDLLTPPQPWATIEYLTVTSANCSGTLDFAISREGTAHGLAVWFDTELFDGLGLSNAPSEPELVYGQAFFSFEQPVPVCAGMTISVLLQATLTAEYVWRWQTVVRDDSGREVCRFEQSTFFGTPLALQELHKRVATYVPTLGVNGEKHKFVLELMDGRHTLEAIAQELRAHYPGEFSDPAKALRFASEISAKYSG